MNPWHDTEARLRRDAQAVRSDAEPGPTLHHHIMARLLMAPRSARVVRGPTQVLVAVAVVVAVVGGIYVGTHNLVLTPATQGPGRQASPSPSDAWGPPRLVGPSGAAVVQGAQLSSGTYDYIAIGGENFNVRFTVPAGWTWNGWYLSKGGVDLPNGAAVFFYGHSVQVYTDPCQWAGADPHPPTGFTARDVIAALAAQPGRNATIPTVRNANLPDLASSTNRPAIVGRWQGMVVQLTVPSNIVFANCTRGQFRSWGPDTDARSHQGPGQRDLVWAVDLDPQGNLDQRLVIDAASFPGTPAGVMSEIDAILASIGVGRWG